MPNVTMENFHKKNRYHAEKEEIKEQALSEKNQNPDEIFKEAEDLGIKETQKELDDDIVSVASKQIPVLKNPNKPPTIMEETIHPDIEIICEKSMKLIDHNLNVQVFNGPLDEPKTNLEIK